MNGTENILHGINLRKIRHYLKRNPSHINHQTVSGKTPLMHAIKKQRIDIMDYFLEFPNCDLNICDNEGYTSLHYACCGGSRKIIETLIAKGVNGNIKDFYGYTPFYIAVRTVSDPNILLLLVQVCNPDEKSNGGDTLLTYYSGFYRKDPEIFSVLVNLTSDINHRNELGYTALHNCCKFSYSQMFDPCYIRMLIDRGCDVNIKCIMGKTAFELLEPEHLPTIKQMIDLD